MIGSPLCGWTGEAGRISIYSGTPRSGGEYHMTRCIACGMLMLKASDYSTGDMNMEYCCHCCRSDGTMMTYEERHAGFVDFIMRTQGFDEAGASLMADCLMRELPAWSRRDRQEDGLSDL
ncbi:MAG: hypothetical protein LBS92_06915 [Candidatus Methanoplasma sp.]|nr:hypothetical protein [Candidatus Methanoplasma sp.]